MSFQRKLFSARRKKSVFNLFINCVYSCSSTGWSFFTVFGYILHFTFEIFLQQAQCLAAIAHTLVLGMGCNSHLFSTDWNERWNVSESIEMEKTNIPIKFNIENIDFFLNHCDIKFLLTILIPDKLPNWSSWNCSEIVQGIRSPAALLPRVKLDTTVSLLISPSMQTLKNHLEFSTFSIR